MARRMSGSDRRRGRPSRPGGRTREFRPGYEQLIRLVQKHSTDINVLVIEDLSRLSRAAADLFTLQRLFEFLEVRLIGVADGIDTFAKHSTLTFGLKSLVSTIYLSDL